MINEIIKQICKENKCSKKVINDIIEEVHTIKRIRGTYPDRAEIDSIIKLFNPKKEGEK